MSPSVERLVRLGLRPDEAGRRKRLFDIVATELGRAGIAGEVAFYHVPGRIEVLGKHTDYAGGRSLVCATEQGIAVGAAPRSDSVLRVIDAARSEQVEVAIDPDRPTEPGRWSNYPITVATRLARDFGPGLAGLDLVFASDIPIAAGVSSSSALVVATAKALIDRNELAATPRYRDNIGSLIGLAGYLGALENGRPFAGFDAAGGVGTMGGSQDQTAILCSVPDALSQFRFDPVEFEASVAWPEELEFVIAASGVLAEKTGAALEQYNGIARRTVRLARLVTGAAPNLTLGRAILDRPGSEDPIDAGLRAIAALPDQADAAQLRNRLVQLVSECRTIIPGVRQAFERGNLDLVRDLVAASQHGAQFGLENQIPETISLVDLAIRGGAVAASAFGAGFGGSVWAVIGRNHADEFLAGWRQGYSALFPARESASFFRTRPAVPAGALPP